MLITRARVYTDKSEFTRAQKCANSNLSVCYSFVKIYTANVGRITNSTSEISTKAYDPKQSTKVWNFRIPSTSRTRSENQQTPNIAANLSFLFFSFIIHLF